MTGTREKMIGRSERRQEDAALVSGRACFTDDVALDAPLYLAFLRSPVASARILSLDLEAAAASPGVHAVHWAEDIGATSVLSVNTVLPLERALPFPSSPGTRSTASVSRSPLSLPKAGGWRRMASRRST
jgi:carbon-monoxide dehydrogenase large subunit